MFAHVGVKIKQTLYIPLLLPEIINVYVLKWMEIAKCAAEKWIKMLSLSISAAQRVRSKVCFLNVEPFDTTT